MDFVTHLQMTAAGYDCITKIVDRFSKRVRLVPCKGTETASDGATLFFAHISGLDGLPDSIVSDRDPKFTSKSLSHLMICGGIRLWMLTSRHPQTEGSTEIMNLTIENHLRCYCAFIQDNWDKLLCSAKFAYNSAQVNAMEMTPFEADLGWPPKSPLNSIANYAQDHLRTVTDIKENLEESFLLRHFLNDLPRLAGPPTTARNIPHALMRSKIRPFLAKRCLPTHPLLSDRFRNSVYEEWGLSRSCS